LQQPLGDDPIEVVMMRAIEVGFEGTCKLPEAVNQAVTPAQAGVTSFGA
jgi:hypothetical protein